MTCDNFRLYNAGQQTPEGKLIKDEFTGLVLNATKDFIKAPASHT